MYLGSVFALLQRFFLCDMFHMINALGNAQTPDSGCVSRISVQPLHGTSKLTPCVRPGIPTAQAIIFVQLTVSCSILRLCHLREKQGRCTAESSCAFHCFQLQGCTTDLRSYIKRSSTPAHPTLNHSHCRSCHAPRSCCETLLGEWAAR